MSDPFEQLTEDTCKRELGDDFRQRIIMARLRSGPCQPEDLIAFVERVESEFGFLALLKMAITDDRFALRVDENGEIAVCAATGQS